MTEKITPFGVTHGQKSKLDVIFFFYFIDSVSLILDVFRYEIISCYIVSEKSIKIFETFLMEQLFFTKYKLIISRLS